MMSEGEVLFRMTSYRHPPGGDDGGRGQGGLRVEKILVPEPPAFTRDLNPAFFEFASGVPVQGGNDAVALGGQGVANGDRLVLGRPFRIEVELVV